MTHVAHAGAHKHAGIGAYELHAYVHPHLSTQAAYLAASALCSSISFGYASHLCCTNLSRFRACCTNHLCSGCSNSQGCTFYVPCSCSLCKHHLQEYKRTHLHLVPTSRKGDGCTCCAAGRIAPCSLRLQRNTHPVIDLNVSQCIQLHVC